MKNDREGSVLAMVLVIFVVLSILTMSILYIFSTNTKQIVAQKNNMKAYYLAQSGVEIGYAAIEKSGGTFFDSSSEVKLTNEIDLISDAGGKITKIILKKTPLGTDDLIDISAEAIHIDTNTKATVGMKYLLSNPSLRTWY